MQDTPVPEDTAHQMLMSLLQYLSTLRDSETLGKLEGNVEWHKLKVSGQASASTCTSSVESTEEVTDLSVALRV